MKNNYSIISLIAILAIFLFTTLVQGYFTWTSINDERLNRIRMEANVENDKVNERKNVAENTVDNSVLLFEQHIDSLPAIKQLLLQLLQKNPQLLGSAVAYVPGYLPGKERLLSPYAYREHDKIRQKLLIYDYTQFDWYTNVVDRNSKGWCEPYVDGDATQALMSTYSVPLHNKQGKVVAVLTADLPMHELTLVSNDVYHAASKRSILILVMQIFSILLIMVIAWKAISEMRKREMVRKEKERATFALTTADRMQKAIMPAACPQHPNLLMSGRLLPADDIGADFYDFMLNGNTLHFCIGDVSTHGLGASMAMLVARTAYRTSITNNHSPAQAMAMMNGALADINEQQMYATLFSGELDLQTGMLTYCNAGHQVPFLLRGHDVQAVELVSNVPVGITEWDFRQQQLQLQKGDTLFLYNDGIIEAANTKGETFGSKRLLLHLRNAATAQDQPEALMKRMLTALQHHLGVERKASDDLTMLAFRYL